MLSSGKKEAAQELSLLAAQWEKMPRGSQEERNAVEQFYREKIMPLLVETFVARERPKITKKYDGLILSLGESYQPLVLSIATLKPKRVFFLVTEKSRRYLDVVVELTGLKPSVYDFALVDKDNPLQIYEAIKNIYQKWGCPDRIALDFTGGTKAMSGGSAMAGGMIGADMVYIASSRYLSDLRIPYPGSEHLEFIPNPYQVFGDLEEARALDLMAKYDYAGAGRIFAQLARAVPDPRRYGVLQMLARAYEAWDNLNFPAAASAMEEVIARVRQYGQGHRGFILFDRLSRLEEQRQALALLAGKMEDLRRATRRGRHRDQGKALILLTQQDFIQALVATVYSNALRREEQGKLDMAALLLYRLLEMMEQAALAAYGLDTAEPDYGCLAGMKPGQLPQGGADACPLAGLLPGGDKNHPAPSLGREGKPRTLDELRERYGAIRTRIFKKEEPPSLPAPISLFNGFLLLKALDDPLTVDLNLPRLNGLVEKRNFSIFAHGFDFIADEDYREFKQMVEEIADRFLRARGGSLKKLAEKYRFIQPPF